MFQAPLVMPSSNVCGSNSCQHPAGHHEDVQSSDFTSGANVREISEMQPMCATGLNFVRLPELVLVGI